MYKFLIFLSISIICFSCNSSEVDSLEIPENLKLDLDKDGITDFNLTYFQQLTGDPAGNYQEVKLYLESDINQVLKSKEEYPLFINSIDIVETEVTLPLFWESTNPTSNISYPIARIRTDYDETTWNSSWTIFSREEKNTYLIGFKLLGTNTSKIGFIEFLVDTQTGHFDLLETRFL